MSFYSCNPVKIKTAKISTCKVFCEHNYYFFRHIGLEIWELWNSIIRQLLSITYGCLQKRKGWREGGGGGDVVKLQGWNERAFGEKGGREGGRRRVFF